jgi:pyruvate kinase
MHKRTKIVCTIGPASKKVATLRAMIHAGMNVARLNFSHGTYKDHAALIKNILAASKAENEPVALLQDLQGPKIRLGNLPESGVVVKTGQTIALSTASSAFKAGDVPVFPVTFPGLHKDVKAGHRILIDDGLLEVKVTKVSGRVISARVVNGGKVSSHKGMNFPDSTLRVSPITQKDKKDLVFGVKQGVHWIALSFVTSAKDITHLRQLIRKAGGTKGAKGTKEQALPRIIAKIEKHEAIKHFDEILKEVDAIMVARGDLGIEIAAEDVPIRQKEIIEKCRLAGKPVVVATQMLDSMTRNPRPTRAEVSDVANAVIDHADAVMLSGESATGSYPVETVSMMGKIVARAEASPFDDLSIGKDAQGDVQLLLSHTLRLLAKGGHIDGILSAAYFAPWAEHLNMSRPEVPVFIATDNPTVLRQMNIRTSVRPFLLKRMRSADFVKKSVAWLRKNGRVKAGMKLALVLGGSHGLGFDLIEV